MKQLNIPGKLFEDRWKNFEHNRTLALQYARGFSKSDYVFIMDADDTIEGNLVLPEDFGSKDAYFVTLSTCPGFFYKRPSIASNKRNWYYLGVLHEFLHTDEKCSFGDIEGDYFIHARTIGNDEAKYKRDVEIIKKELEENKNIPKFLYSRYLFYLAQSYRDANMKDEAIEAYRERILKGDPGTEIYICFYEIGNLYLSKGELQNAIFYYIHCTQACNKRIEHVLKLMQIFRELGQFATAQSFYRSIDKDVFDVPRNSDFLFLHKDEYDWKIHYESTVCAAHYGDFDVRYQYKRLLQFSKDINNKDIFKNCVDNLKIYINIQKDQTIKNELINIQSEFSKLCSEEKKVYII